jgi:hypothetical protein
MKVLELRFLQADQRALFKGKMRNMFRPGLNTRDDEIAGLSMSLDERTGLISVDIPGESLGLHLSVCGVKLEPAISGQQEDEYVHPREHLAEYINRPAPLATQVQVTAAELGFDPSGDDLDDREIAKLLQGKGAKKKIEAKIKKKPGPKPKPVQVVIDDAEDPDEGDDE